MASFRSTQLRKEVQESTDRSTAEAFLAEGTATRLMIEAIPALVEQQNKGVYATLWNALHSGMVEFALAKVFQGVIWFIPVYVVTLILLIVWPQLALWLPSFIR